MNESRACAAFLLALVACVPEREVRLPARAYAGGLFLVAASGEPLLPEIVVAFPGVVDTSAAFSWPSSDGLVYALSYYCRLSELGYEYRQVFDVRNESWPRPLPTPGRMFVADLVDGELSEWRSIETVPDVLRLVRIPYDEPPPYPDCEGRGSLVDGP